MANTNITPEPRSAPRTASPAVAYEIQRLFCELARAVDTAEALAEALGEDAPPAKPILRACAASIFADVDAVFRELDGLHTDIVRQAAA